jgi:uncharacterized membrane protein YjjP (DUF1212 family)
MKRTMIASATAVLAMAGGVAATAAPADAALINVTVTRVLNNNKVAVQVPINAAANVCGVSVAVLANLLPAPVNCDATANQSGIMITQ